MHRKRIMKRLSPARIVMKVAIFSPRPVSVTTLMIMPQQAHAAATLAMLRAPVSMAPLISSQLWRNGKPSGRACQASYAT